MVTHLSETKTGSSENPSRAQQFWLVVVQVVVLGLTVLALCWVATPDHPTPQKPYQALIAVFALVSLLVACISHWRRGEMAGVICGVTFATACWLSAGRLWDLPMFANAYIPLMTPVALGAAVVLALWGLIVRSGIGGSSRLGKGALAAALVLAAFGGFFYLLINYAPAFKSLYQIDLFQLQEVIAIAILYPLALWLGGIALRPAARWNFLPAGMGVILLVFLLLWHVR